MKKAFFISIVLLLLLSFNAPGAWAVCSVDRESRIFPKTVTVQGTTLDVSGKTYDLPASRCTGKQPDGVYTLWCDTQSEANAYDSIIVPLCGSSVELGKANSSCWTCGGDYRCAGLSFGLGETDSFINTIHGQVNQGDTNTDQVWRITHDQVQQNLNANGKFVFNGHEYDLPPGDLIVCNANVAGCGAPAGQCTSTLYPTDKFEKGTGNLPLTEEGIPIRQPAVPITDLNTVPGNTAITKSDSQRLGAFAAAVAGITRSITSFFRFPTINGQPKTSESNLNIQMQTALGTLEPGWNDQGRLTGADQGGKLMPLMLAENSLSWPIEKEGSLMTEKYAKRTCSWFGLNKPSGIKGRISPTMAETEVLKPDLPITLAGTSIWGALFGTQYYKGNPGLPTLNIGTPRQEWGTYSDQEQEMLVKEAFRDPDTSFFYDCGDESSHRKNNFNLFTVLFGSFSLGSGSGAGGGGLYEITSNPADFINEGCSGLQCVAQYFLPWTTETTITIGSDGHPALFSNVLGGEHILQGGKTDANVEDLAKNYRGYARTFLALSTQEDLRINDYHNYGHADTDLPTAATVNIVGSNQTLGYVTHAGVASEQDGFVLQECAIAPLSKQTEMFGSGKCDEVLEKSNATPPSAPNTSTWAISQTMSSQPFTPSGNFEKLLRQFSQDTGVPQCVLEGVADIEGGDRYRELPLDQCLATVNRCSAVGPMQFTTGRGPASDPTCSTCDAGYCPNAWGTYGNGGNPCSYADSLSAASRYLADFGHFDGNDLKDSVHDAATAYYGSDNDATARRVLGGCEYWEYVYRTCESSYVCQANR